MSMTSAVFLLIMASVHPARACGRSASQALESACRPGPTKRAIEPRQMRTDLTLRLRGGVRAVPRANDGQEAQRTGSDRRVRVRSGRQAVDGHRVRPSVRSTPKHTEHKEGRTPATMNRNARDRQRSHAGRGGTGRRGPGVEEEDDDLEEEDENAVPKTLTEVGAVTGPCRSHFVGTLFEWFRVLLRASPARAHGTHSSFVARAL